MSIAMQRKFFRSVSGSTGRTKNKYTYFNSTVELLTIKSNKYVQEEEKCVRERSATVAEQLQPHALASQSFQFLLS